MKLSEAIRIGSKLSPQAFGELAERRGTILARCVWGAAVAGAVSKGIDQQRHADEVFPIVKHLVSCPACEHPTTTIHLTMIHLNDKHRWTREAIADWVEQFEEKDVPTPQTVTVKEEIHVQEHTAS